MEAVRECAYRIQSKSAKVLQLRIDFNVTLTAPSLPIDSPQSPISVPTCMIDEFIVGPFRLCGSNENQHGMFLINLFILSQ